MTTLPKHIQEAATPLTDKHFRFSSSSVDDKDFARQLERIIIWQQEVMDMLVEASFGMIPVDNTCTCMTCQSMRKYQELQDYLKTMKGEVK